MLVTVAWFLLCLVLAIAGGAVGALVGRRRVALVPFLALALFTALHGQIIDAMTPERCDGVPDCPDPNVPHFWYVIGWINLALATGTTVAGAGWQRRRRRRPSRGPDTAIA